MTRPEEQRVREVAAEVFFPGGVDIWMSARNRMLGGISPSEAIENGDSERVLQIIEALADGNF